MPRRLSKEEVRTIRELAEKGLNHCEIGRRVDVTEEAVREHYSKPRIHTYLLVETPPRAQSRRTG